MLHIMLIQKHIFKGMQIKSLRFGGRYMPNILCIDIGGTRIKAAILNDNITTEELKKINVTTIGTLGWMNNSLPQIIDKNHSASLICENGNLEHYDSITIGVPLKVVDNGKSVEGHYTQFGVPENLLEAFKEKANCDTVITSDSIAWLQGTLKYFQLSSIEIEFPCLAVILGTGVGLAYSDSHTKIKGLELNEHNYYFENLSDVLNEDIHMGGRIHDVLGEKFFQYVKDTKRSWTYVEIQNEYTERLIAFLKDSKETTLYNYKDIRSIIIGGGNSKYLCFSSLQSNLDKSIYNLDKNYLKVNPDLIPLLGLLALSNKSLSK
jgi:hypothetical protein